MERENKNINYKSKQGAIYISLLFFKKTNIYLFFTIFYNKKKILLLNETITIFLFCFVLFYDGGRNKIKEEQKETKN